MSQQNQILAQGAHLPSHYIEATKHWLDEVVIGLNFCPFAKKPFINDVIDYHVTESTTISSVCQAVIERILYLQANESVETCLVIIPSGFDNFEHYLDLVDEANYLLEQSGFEDEFQLASFHPQYCFAGSDPDEAANYTNRSPWPIVHIIREVSIDNAFKTYKQPEQIPERNVEVAEQKGATYFIEILKRLVNNQKET